MGQYKKFYSAIGKSMVGRYAVYSVSLLSMMILARQFTPQSFGIVASIVVFFQFFQLIAEVGLGPAIINLNKLDEENRNGLFGLTLCTGLIFAFLFALLGPLFLLFYQLPRVDEVVPYIAISLFFSAACIVPSALLLREQAYFCLASAGLFAEFLSTTITIVLAQFIDPLHALAAKSAFSACSSFGVLVYFSGNTEFGRPALGRKFSAIMPLLGFSSYQFGFNIINYFSRNLDNILVGKYMGAETLGVYDKAYQLMRYPLMLLTAAMTPAIQPVIRKLAGDRQKAEAIHRDFTFKLSLIGSAIGLLTYVLAEWIVLIILGEQWLDVIPIIRILAISIPVQVVLSTCGSFFQAMNRVDLLFLSGTLSAVFIVSAILLGIYRQDVPLLCWCLVAAFHISFFQTYYFMYHKVFKISMNKFLLGMSPAGIVIFGMIIF